ncbi:MAG TPA: N-methyl-L-tryptophan oxidase [Terracidiphilus sp.]|jgi:sarcosine oxidase|nr:N-methyl-L-tryptophan oxidase [Terracidiphilus sp.]
MFWDVIILGLGAMGSATAYHLARRGKRVLAIEQFTSPHDQGSSHGGSRIIRRAYWEGAEYIPLVSRAYELWHQLERDTGIPLLNITGGAVIGSRDGDLVTNTISAAHQHAVPIDILDPSAFHRKFPPFALQPGDLAVHEPGAGYLIPEDCIRAHLELASRAGADLHFQEKVLSWNAGEREVEVTTSRGTYRAGHLVITAGPWANEALAGRFPLRVTRQVMAWIDPRGGTAPFIPGSFPIYVAEDPRGGVPIYGFPAIDGPAGGVKVALHGSDDVCTPETIDRNIHASDLERLLDVVKLRIPALDGPVLQAKTCLYTMTPDEHFIIGPHPKFSSCSVACGFSGHGFKFSSVVGEVLADLAINGTTQHPISLFSPKRLAR